MKRQICVQIIWLQMLGTIPSLWGMEVSSGVLTNHVGYPPAAAKFCLMEGGEVRPFTITDTRNNKTVFQGEMRPHEGAFGVYLIGDFSKVKKEGRYRVEVGNEQSARFEISTNIYDDAIRKCVTYFSVQRCGPSTTGYVAPCHVDDGRRLDAGSGWNMKPHRDVSGGWHDACDFRKWVEFTIHGMIGLCKVSELLNPEWDNGQILEELRWGNRYFLNMQNESGWVMNYCGGDDGQYLTDNIIGTADDRPLHTEPASFMHQRVERIAQYNYVIAQALTARIARQSDPDYARKCLDAAVRCFDWCHKNFYANRADELGAGLMACIELYKTTGDAQYLERAIVLADRLLEIQVLTPIDDVYRIRGFFTTSSRDQEPSRHIWRGPQHLIGLCDLYETVPDHRDAPRWKEAIRLYCEEFILPLAERNDFHLVPWGLFLSEDPGGNRKIGDYWVRYLSVTDNAREGGINANIASSGIGLLKASRILANEKLKMVAQRQLDWILGANPFCASTVEKVGNNQPLRFTNKRLKIPPLIPGAVMNGIGGTKDDHPHLKPASWQNCEYWTPPVAFTMWLMAELQMGSE